MKLKDKILAERNDTYKYKSVNFTYQTTWRKGEQMTNWKKYLMKLDVLKENQNHQHKNKS